MEDLEKEKLKEKLINKIELEYNNYVKKLKELSNIMIIENAYQLVTKREIANYIEYSADFSTREIKLLLKNKNVLDKMYDEWTKQDSNYYELLQFPVDKALKEYRELERRKVREER